MFQIYCSEDLSSLLIGRLASASLKPGCKEAVCSIVRSFDG
jgi:hypothetical protein